MPGIGGPVGDRGDGKVTPNAQKLPKGPQSASAAGTYPGPETPATEQGAMSSRASFGKFGRGGTR